MPVRTTYPGVYVEELPSGVRTITGVSTSTTAFVGYTPQGPFNVATRLLSPGDYERTFGSLHRDSAVSYAVRQFFDNGGSDAYVVRVAQGVDTAGVSLGDTLGNVVLDLSAANPGTWGNLIEIEVDYDTSNPDSTFNMAITQYSLENGQRSVVATETHRNMSMSSTSGAYAEDIINATSALVTAEIPAGIPFSEPGIALTGDLSLGFSLSVTEMGVDGVLDGTPFSILMTGTPPSTAETLEASLNAALTAAGLSGDLVAERADANLAASATGNHVRLVSQNPGEHSQVLITNAAAAMRFGSNNGGRSRSGAAVHRPAPTGTVSGDLSDRMGATLALGSLAVRVTDQASGTVLLAPTNLVPATSDMGPGLRDALQAALRGIANSPATANATVELVGGSLRMLTSADSPNVSIEVTGGGGANGLRTAPAQGGFENVQTYAMGTGATFGAQSNASTGADGDPPSANEIIGSYDDKTGIYALRDVDLFNILCIPETAGLPDTEALSVIDAAVGFCEDERAFYIVDPRSNRTFGDISDWVDTLPKSKNAAVYFPRIRAADPLDGFRLADMPASGAMAGLYARIDTERGVWKAPAGTEAGIRGTQGLGVSLTDAENGTLNPVGINTLRTFPVFGRVAWGARTLVGADAQASEWKYVPVRRTALYIEESLFRGLKWAVFEPNDEPLWAQIRLNVGAFMHDLFRKGAFQGSTPRDAYLVKCDSETTTQNDINLGIVNILVGFAPLKPAEFVILKIQQLAGQTT